MPNPLAGNVSGTPPGDPYELFAAWYGEAHANEAIRYPAAACLSTVEPTGFPDGRTVLLMHFDSKGFVFFTDDRSEKARQLALAPRAALTFYWESLERQVRIQGVVEETSDEVSDFCFEERPRRSRITAWASRQSQPLEDPADLDRRMAQWDTHFAEVENVPRPPHWQGFRVVPRALEFWQAGARRLHHRRIYQRSEAGRWTCRRLEP